MMPLAATLTVTETPAITTTSAIFGNRFMCDANAKDELSYWPMPTVSLAAKELLFAMLNHALQVSSRLVRLDHVMKIDPREVKQVDECLRELLTVKFAMPCEGSEHPIPTLDAATLEGGQLVFMICALYASHLRFLGLANAPLVGSEVAEPLFLHAAERSLLVKALQCFHTVQENAWTHAAIEAELAKRLAPSVDTYELPDTRSMLARLRAQPGGHGL